VTRDADLLDEVLRLAAARGVEPAVAPDAVAARRAWSTAPAVIVDVGVAPELVRAGVQRRDSVLLVTSERDDADVWARAVTLGAERVVVLPDEESVLVEWLADALDGPLDAVTVAVVGGRGGAGASTTAAALALTAARAARSVLLVDADPLGGGLDLMLGGEDVEGLRWADLVGARGRLAPAALLEALPRMDGPAVLSCGRGETLDIPAEAMRSVLAAAGRCSDVVVVDLPRGQGPAAEVALAGCDVCLLVVPAEVRACAAAARVAATIAPWAADVRVLVRGPAPSRLPADLVADAIGLPLAGVVRAEPGLAERLERGEPPTARGRGPLAEFCARFLIDMTAVPRAAA
jgi:secretion/DNA translocation related CpaE-like protein